MVLTLRFPNAADQRGTGMKITRAIHSALVIWLGVAVATLAASSLLSPTMRFVCVGFCVIGLIASFAVGRNRCIRFYASSSRLTCLRPDRSQPHTPRHVEIIESDKSLTNA